MILRDCIVVVSDYLFFLFVEHTSNGLEDFKVIFMLLIEIFHLQMISYLFSFWKDSIIGYIVAFIVFFIPVMVCGFYFQWEMLYGKFGIIPCYIFLYLIGITSLLYIMSKKITNGLQAI